MKRLAMLLACGVTAVCVSGPLAVAQRPDRDRGARDFRPGDQGRPDGRPEDGRRGPPFDRMLQAFPLFAALDADKDGKITASEIKNAAAALKKLDKNGDGVLDQEELRPQFPGMRGGPGGFGPPRGDRPGRPDSDADRPARPDGAAGGRPFGPGRDRAGGPPNPEEMVNRLMQLDKNGDGKLEKDELPERMVGIMERADKDNDGYLTKEELAGMRGPGGRPGGGPRGGDAGGPPEGRLNAMFEAADKDGDGKLSKDEAPERLADRFDQVDRNGDGFVDREELSSAVRRGGPQRGDAPRRARPDRPNDAN